MGGDGMDGRAEALAGYLVGLALLEQTGDTYVKKEIREVLDEIKRELGLKK
jgi:hypothetical protein